jgi:hypothetical protein
LKLTYIIDNICHIDPDINFALGFYVAFGKILKNARSEEVHKAWSAWGALPKYVGVQERPYPSTFKKSLKDLCNFYINVVKEQAEKAGISSIISLDYIPVAVSLGSNPELDKKLLKTIKENLSKDDFDKFEQLIFRTGPENSQNSKQKKLKRVIYKNDKPTIDYANSLGINFKSFINLIEPELVYETTIILKDDAELKKKAVYASINEGLKDLDLKLACIKPEDSEVYADEIADIIYAAIDKYKLNGKFAKFKEAYETTKKKGNISFALASRDDFDRKLGDLCGDCTAKNGINADKVDSWIADVNTQFLKLFYDGKFIGRFNVVLVEANEKPALLIDAVEFVPQAREVDKYSQRAREAFKAGIEKVIELSERMNVPQVMMYTFSNSSGVEAEAKKIGYSEMQRYDIKLIRKTPPQKVINSEEEVSYFLQTRQTEGDTITRRQVQTFEWYINKEFSKDPERKSKLKKLIAEENFKEASKNIINYDENERLHPMLSNIFKTPIYEHYANDITGIVYDALQILYGTESNTTGVPLTKIK